MREYKASLSYAIISPIKIELIAKMIRWKSTQEALTLLSFLPKKAARILYKIVQSAYSNAKVTEWNDVDTVISTIDIGKGPTIKRMRFTSRARVYGYLKHRSFVRVILSVK